MGFQTAILWRDGRVVFGPYQAGNDSSDPDIIYVIGEKMPINTILREFGVTANEHGDEFIVAGLLKYRYPSEWIARAESDNRE
jgi:hypothetical protein